MDEQWRQITGYEALYEISNHGRVKRKFKKYAEGKLLKTQMDKDGYMTVGLCKNGKKETKRVHRLVAEAFIDNPENLPVVNHKDEIKTNNHFSNLEWCTVKYNTNYGDCIKKRTEKRGISIIATKGQESFIFPSIAEAARSLNVNRANVIGCLNQSYGRKTCKGYSFNYAEVAG